MNKRRYSNKFVRQQEPSPVKKLTDRDIAILWLTYHYRFIDSFQIAALLGSTQLPINVRLRKLWQNGYIDRPKNQRYLLEPPEGTRPMIYTLARQGFSELEKRSNEPLLWRQRSVQREHLGHTMMISDFRAVLSIAVKKSSKAQLNAFQKEDRNYLRGRTSEIREGKTIRYPIYPDGLFLLEIDGRFGKVFFIEADNSTTSTNTFGKKVRGYFVWKTRGDCEKQFNIKNFRVLTFCETQKRMNDLINATRKEVGDSNLFWFTTTDNITLKDTQRILGEIWVSPDGEIHSLLE